jgi:hypothetical protein
VISSLFPEGQLLSPFAGRDNGEAPCHCAPYCQQRTGSILTPAVIAGQTIQRVEYEAEDPAHRSVTEQ